MPRPAVLAVPLAVAALAVVPVLALAGPEATPVAVQEAFHRVESRGDFDVEVREGTPASVEIVAEPGQAGRIQVETSGDVLRLSRRREFDSARGIVVRVVVPELRGLSVGGSGKGTAETGPAARDLQLGVSGSGDLDWKGTAAALDLGVSGSGHLEATGNSTRLGAGVSGSGALDVRGETGKASVAVSGSGDARLAGRAGSLEVRISGSGDVDAKAFPAKDVSVAIAGSGDADVQLDGGTLSAQIAGSGDVRWSGEGKLGAVSTAGSGRVKRR